MSRSRCVIKCTRSHPSDRDRRVEMRRGSFNHDRYNSIHFNTCADDDQWSARTPDRRAMIHAPSDPTLLPSPRHLHIINSVELSPTWRKLKEQGGVGFIICIK